MCAACESSGEPFFFPTDSRQQECQEDKSVISKPEARGKKIWRSDAYPLMNLTNNAHILPNTRKCTLGWSSKKNHHIHIYTHIHLTNMCVRCVMLERSNPTEWPCRDGVRQLCVMQPQSTEREQLFEHQGEASGSSCITRSPSSWLEHSCHISLKLSCASVPQFNEAEQGASMSAVPANSWITPLAVPEPLPVKASRSQPM